MHEERLTCVSGEGQRSLGNLQVKSLLDHKTDLPKHGSTFQVGFADVIVQIQTNTQPGPHFYKSASLM